MTSTLVELMEQDGHPLIKAGQDKYMVCCPFHEDAKPSCSVRYSDGKWFYYCFGCGAKGDDITYLEARRGMTKKDALAMQRGEFTPQNATRKPLPAQNPSKKTEKPRKILKKLPSNHVARYVYRDARNEVSYVVQRYMNDEGDKYFGQYTKTVQGWAKGLTVSENRPLYRLQHLLKADPARQVMVVEGEKCADMVAEHFPKTVVVSWVAGTNSWSKSDWSVLHGRSLLIVADGDNQGYICAAELANSLAKHCPAITLVLPTRNKRDIADEIASDKKGVAKWLRAHARTWDDTLKKKLQALKRKIQADQKAASQVRVSEARKLDGLRKNDWFIIGGVDSVSNQVSITAHGEVRSYTMEQLSDSMALITLCPDREWWVQKTGAAPSNGDGPLIAKLIFSAAARPGPSG